MGDIYHKIKQTVDKMAKGYRNKEAIKREKLSPKITRQN